MNPQPPDYEACGLPLWLNRGPNLLCLEKCFKVVVSFLTRRAKSVRSRAVKATKKLSELGIEIPKLDVISHVPKKRPAKTEEPETNGESIKAAKIAKLEAGQPEKIQKPETKKKQKKRAADDQVPATKPPVSAYDSEAKKAKTDSDKVPEKPVVEASASPAEKKKKKKKEKAGKASPKVISSPAQKLKNPPMPSVTNTPKLAAVPAKPEKLTETPKPAEKKTPMKPTEPKTPKAVETPKPAEPKTPKVAQTPKPTEPKTPKGSAMPKPDDLKTPKPVTKTPQAAPSKTPAVTPKPVQTKAPVVTPKPKTPAVAAKAQTPAAIHKTKTPAVTPKAGAKKTLAKSPGLSMSSAHLDLSVLLGDSPSPKKAPVTPKQKLEKVKLELLRRVQKPKFSGFSHFTDIVINAPRGSRELRVPPTLCCRVGYL